MAVAKKIPKYDPVGSAYCPAHCLTVPVPTDTAPTATTPPPPPLPLPPLLVVAAIASKMVDGQKPKLAKKTKLTQKNTLSVNRKEIGRKRTHKTDTDAMIAEGRARMAANVQDA